MSIMVIRAQRYCEKAWEEELPAVLPPPPRIPVSTEASKPLVLPPCRQGFWGMALALGEKAATWSEAAQKIAPSAQPDQQCPPPLKQQLSNRAESIEGETRAVPSLPPPIHQNLVLQLRYHLKLGEQHPHPPPKLQNRRHLPNLSLPLLQRPYQRAIITTHHYPTSSQTNGILPLYQNPPRFSTWNSRTCGPRRTTFPPFLTSARSTAARGASRLASNVASEPISRPGTPPEHAASTVSEKMPESNVNCPPSDAAPATETESSSGHLLKENDMEGAVNNRDAGVMPVLKAPIVKVAGPDGEEKNDETHGRRRFFRCVYGSSKPASPSPFSPTGTDVNVTSDPEQQDPEEKVGEDKER
ncbi:hypothetical protein M378DRAFT_173642 [Amanita muscaria Koide BX008]|uniref:Uncharacterized protein n=1 Tax=Amanita muscaria (strain Koide BX008) TaxID=946122 RepID=A0A0C2WFR8_AMAMK|nr:hypothetical protein M378DRAFT_173642 [Amanita muscaria Koide BX008]